MSSFRTQEQDLLPFCLASLQHAVQRSSTGAHLMVVADACRDLTAQSSQVSACRHLIWKTWIDDGEPAWDSAPLLARLRGKKGDGEIA